MTETRTPDVEYVTNTGMFSGEGMFSEVYIMPEGKAVKICKHANADAWLWWALYCMKHEGEAEELPKVYGIKIDYENNSYVAVLDEMVDVDRARHEDWDAFDISHLWNAEELSPVSCVYDVDPTHNIMYLGETMKVNDPLAYRGWFNIKEHTSDRCNLDAFIEACCGLDLPIEIIKQQRTDK